MDPVNSHQYVFWRGRGNRPVRGLLRRALARSQQPGLGRGRGAERGRGRRTATSSCSGSARAVASMSPGTRARGWGRSGRWLLGVGLGAYAEVIETTPGLSERMTPLSDAQFASGRPRHLPVITVNDAVRYQRVKGVGAAMTDTSAWLIQNQLGPGSRTALMNDLFTKDGIHLGFTLIPMGGSDFSVAGQPYTYDDLPAGQIRSQPQPLLHPARRRLHLCFPASDARGGPQHRDLCRPVEPAGVDEGQRSARRSKPSGHPARIELCTVGQLLRQGAPVLRGPWRPDRRRRARE